MFIKGHIFMNKLGGKMGHSSLTVSLHTSHTQRDTHTENAEPFVDVLYNKAASV